MKTKKNGDYRRFEISPVYQSIRMFDDAKRSLSTPKIRDFEHLLQEYEAIYNELKQFVPIASALQLNYS